MDAKAMQFIGDKFGLTCVAHKDPLFTMGGSKLSEDEGMHELIKAYTPLIKALEPAVTGAYVAGRLSALCAAMQYMLSSNEIIDISPERWTLELYIHEKGYYDFHFRMNDVRPMEGPVLGKREAWRQEQLTLFYRDNLRPIIEAINRVTGLNKGHLWKLIPGTLKYAVDEFIAAAECESMRDRFMDDWIFLSKGMESSVFGLMKNPLDVTFHTVDYPGAPGEKDRPLRVKTACCLYYRTEGGQFCYTCPRMKQEERERRKEVIRAALAAPVNIAGAK